MRAKGYFGILMIILIALGLRPTQEVKPNQQIILQFSESATTSEVAENTLANVKQQLTDAGAYNVKAEKLASGQLKITYFSSFNVDYIKEILLEHTIAYTTKNESNGNLPLSTNYDLDIVEIQNGIDSNSGFDNFFIPSPNHKYDSSVNFKINFYSTIIEDYSSKHFKVAIQINKKTAQDLDTNSYKIPEVRAGPITRGDI